MLEKELFCRIEIEHRSTLLQSLFFIFISSCYVRPPNNGIKDGDIDAEENYTPNNVVDLFNDLC